MTSSTTAVTLQKVAQCKQDSEIPIICVACVQLVSSHFRQHRLYVNSDAHTWLSINMFPGLVRMLPSKCLPSQYVCIPSTSQDAVVFFFHFFVMVHISHLRKHFTYFNICKIDWNIVSFVFSKVGSNNHVYLDWPLKSIQCFMTLTT